MPRYNKNDHIHSPASQLLKKNLFNLNFTFVILIAVKSWAIVLITVAALAAIGTCLGCLWFFLA